MIKEKLQPSPGLIDAIKRLEIKRDNLIQSIELWKTFLKVYPGYFDRDGRSRK